RARGIRALLAPRPRADRAAPRRRYLPRGAATAAPHRPLERRLRARAARQARPRLRRARVGRVPPLLRAPRARAPGRALAPAAQPRRGERGRDGRTARRSGARRLEAATPASPAAAAGRFRQALAGSTEHPSGEGQRLQPVAPRPIYADMAREEIASGAAMAAIRTSDE